MVEPKSLCTGDRVVIVDRWVPGCRQNNEGYMDKWLGKVVTVSSKSLSPIGGGYIRIEEDGGKWKWYGPAIADVDYGIDGKVDTSEISAFCHLFGGA